MTKGVYLITCTATGDQYVGWSTQLEVRWQQHQKALTKKYHHNPRMQELADKHGVGSFTFEILEVYSQEAIGESEWIRRLQPTLNGTHTDIATAKRKAQWTSEKKQEHGQMLRELWAKRKAPRSEEISSAIEAAIATLEQHGGQLTAGERLRIRRVLG